MLSWIRALVYGSHKCRTYPCCFASHNFKGQMWGLTLPLHCPPSWPSGKWVILGLGSCKVCLHLVPGAFGVQCTHLLPPQHGCKAAPGTSPGSKGCPWCDFTTSFKGLAHISNSRCEGHSQECPSSRNLWPLCRHIWREPGTMTATSWPCVLLAKWHAWIALN